MCFLDQLLVARMRQEAQAIVLAAGPGMRMTALTSHTPKCLLPLGTLPMLCYPLHLLQQAGFTGTSSIHCYGACRGYRHVMRGNTTQDLLFSMSSPALSLSNLYLEVLCVVT